MSQEGISCGCSAFLNRLRARGCALPSKSLGLEISPAVFRVMLRFWFGLPVLEENESSKGAATCAFCKAAARKQSSTPGTRGL